MVDERKMKRTMLARALSLVAVAASVATVSGPACAASRYATISNRCCCGESVSNSHQGRPKTSMNETDLSFDKTANEDVF